MQTTEEDKTGPQWEKGVFGLAAAESAYRPNQMTREAAIRNAISLQPQLKWDPKNPRTTIGRELFDCVKSYLPSEHRDELELYSAIGTALDRWHGVDGFFKLHGKMVCIDLRVSKQQFSTGNGTILVIMRECTSLKMWRVCRTIADRLLKN